MPTYYHNVESALKRANEFCELGKDDEALECLYDALKSRKHRMVKQIHENIINKFLELCVKCKKSQMAKDGLYCYRNVCQQINIKSWEDCVRKYLELAECKVENAQKTFQSVILDVDDLDQDMTPDILLKTVCSEDAQDRTERIILLPWVKFLWECYRNCLDLLRNIQTLKLYHIVAQNAFKFCVMFSRKSELRKLCNILKMHSMYIQKRQTYLKIDDFETCLTYLDTGFVELESAICMELWQDAFKAIENIHSVINISKKFKHSRIMAHYYDKISCVLWKGQEYLFHAAAILCYFQLVRDQKKNLSSVDIIKLACRVFLSIMAIPLIPVNPTINLVVETDATIIDKKNLLLSSLLDLHKYPTRASLLKDAIRFGIIQHLPKEIKDLFEAMECEIQLNKIKFHVFRVTDYIQNWPDCGLEQYMPLIHNVAVVKLLPILFKIYVNIKISKLVYLTGFSNASELEVLLVDSARKYNLPLRIDHRNMCVHFSLDFNIFQKDTYWKESEIRNSLPDTHLKCLVYNKCALERAVELICPQRERNNNKLLAEKIADRYLRKKDTYQKNLLYRKTVIEKYKENMENLRIRKEEEEKQRLADQLLRFEAAEKERLLRETEERNLRRLRREQEEIKRKILLEKMETFKKTALGSQIIENMGVDDFDNIDPQILFCKQIEEINKERKELSSKLKRQERVFNHMERAKRIEEIPLLIEQDDVNKKTDKEIWKEDQRNKLESAYRKREIDLQKRSRMLTVKYDLENFLKKVKKRNLGNYNQEMATFTKTLQEEKNKRLKERVENRKQERKIKWIKQQELNKDKQQIISTKQDISIVDGVRTNDKRNDIKENVKDLNTKSAASPQKRSNKRCRERDPAYTEDLKSNDEINSFNGDARRGKHFSTDTPDGVNLSKDTYYYKSVFKSRTEEIRRTGAFDQRTSYSRFSSEYTKCRTENYRSDSYGNSNQRVRTTVFEKSEESVRSWRTPSSNNADSGPFPYASQYNQFSKDVAASQRTVTIMQRRDSTLTMPHTNVHKDKNYFAPEFHMQAESQERINDTAHSCTPWAKLKRKELNK